MATGTLDVARPVRTAHKLVIEGIGTGPLAYACKYCRALAVLSQLRSPSEDWLQHMNHIASGCMAGSMHMAGTSAVAMPELGMQPH